MRIGKVIGTVTLSRQHPELEGGRFLLVASQGKDDLPQGDSNTAELVVYDELGAGQSEQLAVSEGAEATMPFRPRKVPIDAYNGMIIDQLTINEEKQP